MKAIVNTTIRFGLINLPVGICKATGEMDDVKFNLADKNGHAVVQQYVDSAGEVVPRDEMTRTFEGHMIPQDAIAAIAEQTKLPDMEISKTEDYAVFVSNMHRITGSYFLQSTKKTGNLGAYKLFCDVLADTGKVAVTKFTFRSRQHQLVIWPDNGILRASTLAFAGDEREPDENVNAHLAASYSDRDFEMAKQLMTLMSEDDANPLEMDVDEAIPLRYELVQQALAGEAIEAPEAAPASEPIPDLAAALQAMLADAEAKKKTKPKKAKAKA